MAKVPNLKSFPAVEGELSEGMEQARPLLDQFISDVSNSYDRGITLENLSVQTKTIELVSTDLPLTINCELPRAPSLVLCGRAEVVTTGGSFTGAVDVSQWQRLDGNRIRFTSIPGLDVNTKYRLTLLIF